MVYDLGQIEATGTASSPDYNATTLVVDSQDMQNTASTNMGHALRFTPGVFFYPGTLRDTIYIRGHNESQIGYYLDGIPVNDTYRGQASGFTDITSFGTFGLSEISVSKGYISPSFGADVLGGAVNMVTSKPKDDLELSLGYMFISSNENRISTSVGRNLGKTYFQLTYSQMDRKSLQYSYDYNVDYSSENAYDIPNTAKNFRVFHGKYGYEPNENHEYSLNFRYQKQKMNGGWNFINYDATTLYLLGSSKLSESISLNSRVYYHMNLNATLSSAKYDDYTAGIIENIKFDFNENQNLKVGINLKHDSHIRVDSRLPNETRSDYKTLNSSIFGEYALKINNIFRLALSASYDRSDALNIWKKVTNNVSGPLNKDRNLHLDGFSVQGIVYTTLGEHTLLHLNIGRKSNIPNMARFYSDNSGVGYNAPSSNINPETALNYEFGADFTWASVQVGGNVFYNDLTNMIISTRVSSNACSNPLGTNPNQYCLQYQNANIGNIIGGEIYAKKSFFDDVLTLGLNWTYVQRKSFNYDNNGNKTATQEFTTHPRQFINFNALFAPQKEWNISLMGSVQTSRFAMINLGNAQTPNYDYVWLPTVVYFDIAGTYFITDSLKLSLGAYNVLDKNYNYSSSTTSAATGGLPGRRVFVGLEYKF